MPFLKFTATVVFLSILILVNKTIGRENGSWDFVSIPDSYSDVQKFREIAANREVRAFHVSAATAASLFGLYGKSLPFEIVNPQIVFGEGTMQFSGVAKLPVASPKVVMVVSEDKTTFLKITSVTVEGQELSPDYVAALDTSLSSVLRKGPLKYGSEITSLEITSEAMFINGIFQKGLLEALMQGEPPTAFEVN